MVAFAVIGADANAAQPQARINADPALIPAFRLKQTDYALRCTGKPVGFSLEVPTGWRAVSGNRNFGPGTHRVAVRMKSGQSRRIRFIDPQSRLRIFHVRCFPRDFPAFEVRGRGGPRLTLVEMVDGYATAFDSGGAPVWWYKARGFAENVKFMSDGTVSYAPIAGGKIKKQFEVRTLEGRLIRRLTAAGGLETDLHDLILRPNGNYLIGAHRLVSGINTKRFSGVANATIDTAQVQEIRPDGSLVWKWNAWPRIKLAESRRWWKQILKWPQPYDIHHWNSIERRGNRVVMSFRHLDAAYQINRRTGNIDWKLGGTKTRQRLRISGDRWGRYPFGGQHDIRYAPGGSVTLFDNSTDLSRRWKDRQPRAVRYRIDARRNRARLIDQVTDDRAKLSLGFGSARLYGDNWLIGWGARSKNGLIGAYGRGGKRLLSIITPGGVSYRGNEVTSKRPALERLRRAMDRMAARRR
ncbi:MAG: aryl-sulfate sulfotransferase [Solirubrobacterales bacterium]